MMILIRWAVSMLMAAGITLGLFYFMQALIATGADLDQRVSGKNCRCNNARNFVGSYRRN